MNINARKYWAACCRSNPEGNTMTSIPYFILGASITAGGVLFLFMFYAAYQTGFIIELIIFCAVSYVVGRIIKHHVEGL